MALVLLAPAAPAYGAFPGANGKIATLWFDSFTDGIHTVNPDGTGDTWLTPSDPGSSPAWSADGAKLAFHSYSGGNGNVFVMNADGTGVTQLTTNSSFDGDPYWSPDGSRIVFESDRDGNRELYVMNADGSDQTRITNNPATERDPSWSPDGSKIAFASNRESIVCAGNPHCTPEPTFRIFTMSADGSDVTRITVTRASSSEHSTENHYHPDWSPSGGQLVYQSAENDYFEEFYANRIFTTGPGGRLLTLSYGSDYPDTGVAWSPDGQYIAWAQDYELHVMSATAGDYGNVISACCNWYPSWQPIPSSQPGGYPRPKGATPFHVALVPAYAPCASPNREHGPPLSFGSCSPPAAASPNLTVGGSGGTSPAKSSGYVRVDAVLGAPGPPDTADAVVTISLSNVMRVSDLSDYTGQLRATATMRMTGRDSGAPSTIQDFPLDMTVPCTATADPTLGAACDAQTTFDSVVPGLAPEGMRSNQELGQVRILDDAGSLFAVQGLFVP